MRQAIHFVLTVALASGATVVWASPQQKHTDIRQIGKRDITRGTWNFYSLEEEAKLGAEMAAEVERTVLLLRDPFVVEYVRDLVEHLVRHSDSRFPAQVRVVDSEERNAMALPGGHFFVNTGLILEAETEAELAGILAHEIAHVAARHATRQRTRNQFWNWVSIPLLLFGGPAGYLYQGMALVVPLTFLQFSRHAEREADFFGLQYHYWAGYDPVAFVAFLERLRRLEKQGESGGLTQVFATHPMTRDRLRRAEQVIEKYLPEREQYVVTTSRFDQVRAYLLGRLDRRTERNAGQALLRLRDRTGREPRDNFPARPDF